MTTNGNDGRQGERQSRSFDRNRDYFKRSEVPTYLREVFAFEVAESSLAKMAVNGGGPPYYKIGRQVVYSRDELDRWAKSKLGRAVRSTAEYAPAQASA